MRTKIRKLFSESMDNGGPRAFRTNFEQLIGVHTLPNGRQVFDPEKRDVNYEQLDIGGLCQDLLGNSWKSTFEQFWVEASQHRSRTMYEGVGSPTMTGDIPTVSAAIDTIAGLWNARALSRPSAPEYIWDQMCSVQELTGEGGFLTITRADLDLNSQDGNDLADDQMPPTVKLKGSRVHRNRTKAVGRTAKLNLYTVLNDTTSTVYESIDEIANLVLYERERKVADAFMGITGPDGAVAMTQDGLTFSPYQAAPGTQPSPENGKLLANFANANNGSGIGLSDYTAMERAVAILANNVDPFTGLPIHIDFQNMVWLVAPAAVIQAKYILATKENWAFNATGLAALGKLAVSEGVMKQFNPQIVSSQLWANRLIAKGLPGRSFSGAATANGWSIAGNVQSCFWLGHPKKALTYQQRQPYTVVQAPLGPQEIGEQTILVQYMRERGSCTWVDGRQVYREYA